MSAETFGARLRARRKKLEMTASQLAAEVHISPQFISDLESDRRRPSTDMLALLAVPLKVGAADMMAWAGRLTSEAEALLLAETDLVYMINYLPQLQPAERRQLTGLVAHMVVK